MCEGFNNFFGACGCFLKIILGPNCPFLRLFYTHLYQHIFISHGFEYLWGAEIVTLIYILSVIHGREGEAVIREAHFLPLTQLLLYLLCIITLRLSSPLH